MSAPDLLADTNIFSYAFNGHSLKAAYAPHLRGRIVVMAFHTLAELRAGVLLAGWGEKRRALLEDYLAVFPVIYPEPSTCTRWAEVRAEAQRGGRKIRTGDAWIAATALELGVPILTHNRADFDMLERLTIISENKS